MAFFLLFGKPGAGNSTYGDERSKGMVIVMKKQATDDEINNVIQWIESVGYQTHPSRGVAQTIIGVVGDDRGKEQLK